MAEKWDKQLKGVLDFTREELKRAKTQAQQLLEEVQDPNNQAKVKEGLQTLRTWAVATGKQAQEQLESAVRRVEEAVGAFDQRAAPPAPPAPAAPVTPPEAPKAAKKAAAPAAAAPAAPPPAPAPAAKKTAARPEPAKSIGRKKATAKPAAKPAAPASKKAAAKPGASKSIGRKKPARPAS